MSDDIITVDEQDSPEGLVLSEIKKEISHRNGFEKHLRNRVIDISFSPITDILSQISLRDVNEIISSAVFDKYSIAPKEISNYKDNDDNIIFCIVIPEEY